MKNFLFSALFLSGTLGLRAENGHQLWLRPHAAVPVTVMAPAKSSAVLATAKRELQQGWQGAAGATLTLALRQDKAIKHDGFRLSAQGGQ